MDAARTASASASPDTPASTEPGAAAAAPAAPATIPERNEIWWKSEMQSRQVKLDAALATLAEAEKANFKYGYNDAQAEYKKRAAAVANARQAIERLRDEARRAGVPPGWLR